MGFRQASPGDPGIGRESRVGQPGDFSDLALVVARVSLRLKFSLISRSLGAALLWTAVAFVLTASARSFEVPEALLCERVEGHECVGPKAAGDRVSEDIGQICLFTRVRSEVEVDTL